MQEDKPDLTEQKWTEIKFQRMEWFTFPFQRYLAYASS